MWNDFDHILSWQAIAGLLCAAVAVGAAIGLAIKLLARVGRATFPPSQPVRLTERICQDSDCHSLNPPAARFCRRCGSTLVPMSRRVGRWLGRFRLQASAKASV